MTDSRWRYTRERLGVSKREAKAIEYGRVAAHKPTGGYKAFYRRLSVLNRVRRAQREAVQTHSERTA